MERKHRRILEGKVVSDKSSKTITVLVKRYQNHPIYKKRVLLTKKYIVHDEKEQAKLGDYVAIMECRPLSARKRFTLSKILKTYEDKNSKKVASVDDLVDANLAANNATEK